MKYFFSKKKIYVLTSGFLLIVCGLVLGFTLAVKSPIAEATNFMNGNNAELMQEPTNEPTQVPEPTQAILGDQITPTPTITNNTTESSTNPCAK